MFSAGCSHLMAKSQKIQETLKFDNFFYVRFQQTNTWRHWDKQTVFFGGGWACALMTSPLWKGPSGYLRHLQMIILIPNRTNVQHLALYEEKGSELQTEYQHAGWRSCGLNPWPSDLYLVPEIVFCTKCGWVHNHKLLQLTRCRVSTYCYRRVCVLSSLTIPSILWLLSTHSSSYSFKAIRTQIIALWLVITHMADIVH